MKLVFWSLLWQKASTTSKSMWNRKYRWQCPIHFQIYKVAWCPIWIHILFANICGYLGIELEKAMTPYSSTLAWKIPCLEEPGRLQSMGSLSRTRLGDFTFTFHVHTLEKEMATYSNILAWRIPGTGKPGGQLSMGLHRVRHDWSDLTA